MRWNRYFDWENDHVFGVLQFLRIAERASNKIALSTSDPHDVEAFADGLIGARKTIDYILDDLGFERDA